MLDLLVPLVLVCFFAGVLPLILLLIIAFLLIHQGWVNPSRRAVLGGTERLIEQWHTDGKIATEITNEIRQLLATERRVQQ
jgi:hypothetical protein